MPDRLEILRAVVQAEAEIEAVQAETSRWSEQRRRTREEDRHRQQAEESAAWAADQNLRVANAARHLIEASASESLAARQALAPDGSLEAQVACENAAREHERIRRYLGAAFYQRS